MQYKNWLVNSIWIDHDSVFFYLGGGIEIEKLKHVNWSYVLPTEYSVVTGLMSDFNYYFE